MSDQISRLTERAYAAALDEELWPGFVELLTEAIGAKAATFAVVNRATGEVRRQLPFRWGSDQMIEDYFSHYQAFDPQLPVVFDVTEPTLYASESHLDERDPATAEYMAWSRGAANLDHHLSAVAPVGETGWLVGFSAHTPVGAGPVPDAARATLQRLLPDLVRAWRLGFDHNEMLATSFWEGLTARGEEAALLLDERGRVVRATVRAVETLVAEDGLLLRRSALGCVDPAEDASLAGLVARAIDPVAPKGGAVQVSRPSGRHAYVVSACPFVRRCRLLAPFDAAALLRVIERPAIRPAPGEALTQAFALTVRERDLALLLHAEHSVESAANTLGIALATARLHLHRVFAKTGTTRQSELIRLMDALG